MKLQSKECQQTRKDKTLVFQAHSSSVYIVNKSNKYISSILKTTLI